MISRGLAITNEHARNRKRRWMPTSLGARQRINSRHLKFARVGAYAYVALSAFRPFSTCGTDDFFSSFFFFSFARRRPDTGPRQRDWTTKRLASLSTKRAAEEISALSPPKGESEPGSSSRRSLHRRVDRGGEKKKKKKNGTRKSR